MLYTEYKSGQSPDDFYASRFGYVIEPDGTILSLRELQVHGQIAYERNAEVRKYYDLLDEDRKNRTMTAAELYATDDLGHIRVSIAPYIHSWSIGNSWTIPATYEQKVALQFLFDVCDVRNDEMWTNTSEMTGEDFLRSI